jgi:hypothetical protein
MDYSLVNVSKQPIEFHRESFVAYVNYRWNTRTEDEDRDAGGGGQVIIERFKGSGEGERLVLEPKKRSRGEIDLGRMLDRRLAEGRQYVVWLELCSFDGERGERDEPPVCMSSNETRFEVRGEGERGAREGEAVVGSSASRVRNRAADVHGRGARGGVHEGAVFREEFTAGYLHIR